MTIAVLKTLRLREVDFQFSHLDTDVCKTSAGRRNEVLMYYDQIRHTYIHLDQIRLTTE